MNRLTPIRRFTQKLLLLLAGASLASCCFHSHCGGYHHCMPVRRCR